jgi:O-antigen/teichoic acid export membrane protein
VKRNLVTAFGAIAGSQVAIILVSALFSPILIRLLGFSTFGEYATLIAGFDLLMILISAGINGGARKYISQEHDDDNWESYVFAYYFRLALVFSFIAALILVAVAKFGLVELIYGPKYAPYFFLLALLVIAAQFRGYVRRTLMGLKLEHLGKPLQVVYKITFVVVAILFALLSYGVAGILVAQIVASMLVFVIGILFVSQHLSLKKLFMPAPDDYPKRDMLYFNYNTIIYMLFLNSLYKVDQVMVGALAGSEQAGYYRAALVLVEFLWLLPRSLQALLIQSTSDHWENGRLDIIEKLATRATRYVLLLTLLLAIGLGALAHVFVPIYFGPNSMPVLTPLYILLPGTVGFAVARPMLTINHAKGDMQILIGTVGVAAGLNLVLNFLLIPRYGMAGAALSTTIGYGSLPILQAWAARRLGYKPFKNARLGRIGATTVLSGTVIGIMSLAIGSTTITDLGFSSLWLISQIPIALLIVPPAGLLLYSLIAIATESIDLGEVFEILVRIPGPIGSYTRPLKQRFDASERFGNEQSRSSAIKLIFSLAAVIVLVSAAAVSVGFPLIAMTPFGTSDEGVFGSVINQPPPTKIPNSTSTPTPTPSPTPTASTATLIPTATPTASTATPIPTATPISTPTPTTSTATPILNTTDTPTPITTTPPSTSPTPTQSPPSPTPPTTTSPTPTQSPPSPTPPTTTSPTPTQTPPPSSTPPTTIPPTPTQTPLPPTATPTPTPTTTPTATSTSSSSQNTTTTSQITTDYIYSANN